MAESLSEVAKDDTNTPQLTTAQHSTRKQHTTQHHVFASGAKCHEVCAGIHGPSVSARNKQLTSPINDWTKAHALWHSGYVRACVQSNWTSALCHSHWEQKERRPENREKERDEQRARERGRDDQRETEERERRIRRERDRVRVCPDAPVCTFKRLPCAVKTAVFHMPSHLNQMCRDFWSCTRCVLLINVIVEPYLLEPKKFCIFSKSTNKLS